MVYSSWVGGQNQWQGWLGGQQPLNTPRPPKLPQHYLPGRVHQLQLELILAHHHHLVVGCKGGTRLGGAAWDPQTLPPRLRRTATSFQGHLSPQHKVLGYNPRPAEVRTRLSSSPGTPQGHQEKDPGQAAPHPPTSPPAGDLLLSTVGS